ncbi:MAG TPA: antibiotic biosynthesis monooxygenase [Chitinophagaceae bacterium]|jgi:heme-degrading monooxygenase HmoA|nr:antibiotic biosynthesis monooxygenase [Chitinophagaceae bacterium]
MVARVWRGYTPHENADAYENFLKSEFMPAIEKKKIAGYKKFQLLRKEETDEVAFITIMWFDSIEQIKAFAGADYEKAVVHPTAQALLKRYDQYAQHFELKHELIYE